MKGIYKTKEGQKVEVVDFDEANKIVMIKLDELQNKWVDESEYLEWESEDDTQIPDEIVRGEEDEAKKKRTSKKKSL